MVSIVLVAFYSVLLNATPENPYCREIREILWEYQQYSELSDQQIREVAGRCFDWAEGESDK